MGWRINKCIAFLNPDSFPVAQFCFFRYNRCNLFLRCLMERCSLDHGFGPFFRDDSRVLILGSFPSVKSRESQFFYGHPQNRFWPLMARLSGEVCPVTIEEKKAFLARNGIALYDVIERCSIVGSSDSSIRDVVPADLKPILERSRIGSRIFTNGKTAYRLYEKYQAPVLGLSAVCMPSTSPANAAFSLDRLTEIWRSALGGEHP